MKGMTLLALAASLVMGAHARADDRDLWMFAQWAGDHETRAFRQMLVDARLYGVVPIHQLLRSASDWRRSSSEVSPPSKRSRASPTYSSREVSVLRAISSLRSRSRSST